MAIRWRDGRKTAVALGTADRKVLAAVPANGAVTLSARAPTGEPELRWS